MLIERVRTGACELPYFYITFSFSTAFLRMGAPTSCITRLKSVLLICFPVVQSIQLVDNSTLSCSNSQLIGVVSTRNGTGGGPGGRSRIGSGIGANSSPPLYTKPKKKSLKSNFRTQKSKIHFFFFFIIFFLHFFFKTPEGFIIGAREVVFPNFDFFGSETRIFLIFWLF